jgi:hypothetical protein
LVTSAECIRPECLLFAQLRRCVVAACLCGLGPRSKFGPWWIHSFGTFAAFEEPERRQGNEGVRPVYPEANLAIRNTAIANIPSQGAGTTTAHIAAVTAKLMVGRQHSKRKSKRAYMGVGNLSFGPNAAFPLGCDRTSPRQRLGEKPRVDG